MQDKPGSPLLPNFLNGLYPPVSYKVLNRNYVVINIKFGYITGYSQSIAHNFRDSFISRLLLQKKEKVDKLYRKMVAINYFYCLSIG